MPAINKRMLKSKMDSEEAVITAITASSESILDFVILCMSENSDRK